MKIPSSEHGDSIGRTWVEHVVHINCSECQTKKQFVYATCSEQSMNNLLSYCGLVDAKIRASDKDLPVLCFQGIFSFKQALHLCRVLQTLLFIIILIVSWWRKYSLTKNDLPPI